MKAQIESAGSNGYAGAVVVRTGRVQKSKKSSGDKKKVDKTVKCDKIDMDVVGAEENQAEILSYFAKLREILPSTPANKELSKVEVIDYAIDYIRELSETLGIATPQEYAVYGDKENFSFR